MVNFNKETFLQNIDFDSFDKDINLSSIEETLKRFPAFNSLYLIQAYLLKQKDDYSFEKNIPFIAINVRDRAVLHDIVHKQEKIIEEEKLESEFLEEIDITALKTIHSEHEKKSKKSTQKTKSEDDVEKIIELKEIKQAEETQEIEKVKKIKEVEVTKELDELIPEEKTIDKIKDNLQEKNITKEEKKTAAMNALQEELFGNVISEKNTSEITLKEQKRIEAIKKLQEELFLRKQENIRKKLSSENIERQIKKEESSNRIKEKNIVTKDENKEVEKTKINEEKINKKPATSIIIEDLIKRQEEKVNDFIEEENTFEEKSPKNDFVNWLKLKKASPKKEIFKDEILESTKKEEKEDLIPFDRTSAIEAEMHQEVKASTDPLENFISSEIIRKKKKRNKKKNVIVSETLAEILTLQQKYTEALEVYQLLSLKYPQKSIYFAHQIEKIKTYL